MDIKQLEYFKTVAELGSFSRAATFLDVAQPALSRQVRSLEVELHVALFERNGRGVTLTDSGKRLLQHSREILEQVDRATRDVTGYRDLAEGRLVMGLPSVLSRTMTVPLIEAFNKHFPHATLSTVDGLSAYIPEWLTIGRLDCAMVYNPMPSPSVDLMPLAEEAFYFISRRPEFPSSSAVGPPIGLREVADFPLIVPGHPHQLRICLKAAMAGVEKKLNVVHEVESITAIVDLVRHGHGFAILPLNAIDTSQSRWDRDLYVQPIVDPPLTSSLWMATSSHRVRGTLAREALDVIREVLHRELAQRAEDILAVLRKSHVTESGPDAASTVHAVLR